MSTLPWLILFVFQNRLRFHVTRMIGDHHQQQQPSKHIELDKSFHLVPHLPASCQDCIIHSFDILSADVITSELKKNQQSRIRGTHRVILESLSSWVLEFLHSTPPPRLAPRSCCYA